MRRCTRPRVWANGAIPLRLIDLKNPVFFLFSCKGLLNSWAMGAGYLDGFFADCGDGGEIIAHVWTPFKEKVIWNSAPGPVPVATVPRNWPANICTRRRPSERDCRQSNPSGRPTPLSCTLRQIISVTASCCKPTVTSPPLSWGKACLRALPASSLRINPQGTAAATGNSQGVSSRLRRAFAARVPWERQREWSRLVA